MNPIIIIYADLVKKHEKTLEDIPENIRSQVKDYLDSH